MSSTLIYSDSDLATDTYVRIEKNPLPMTMWDVTTDDLTSGDLFYAHTQRFESLVDASNYFVKLTRVFEDEDKKSAEDHLKAIAAWFEAPDVVYVDGDGEGGVYLVNENEWDEE